MFACGSMAAACAGSACMTATCGCLGHVGDAVAKTSARALYVVMFAISTALAFVMRDCAQPLLKRIPWIARLATMNYVPGDEWFGAQAVYRISLGNFIFFGAMACALVGVKRRSDARDVHLHHGSWVLKFTAWALCNVIPFFASNGVVGAYTWVARVASGVFLVVQMIILLDFAFFWNESWVARQHAGWLVGLLVSTIVLYAESVAVVVMAFRWFSPRGVDCGSNDWMIGSACALCLAFSLACVHPGVKDGSLLPSAVVTSYCTYLLYSALASEPSEYECNPRGSETGAGAGSRGGVAEIASTALTLASVAYGALRAGSADFFGGVDGDGDDGDGDGGVDASALLGGGGGGGGSDSDDEENGGVGARGKASYPSGPVSYNYAFFHFIFASASAYLAMLMTGWGDRAFEDGGAPVDVGWASVYVKYASLWVTGLLYTWSLVAPAVMPDRDWD